LKFETTVNEAHKVGKQLHLDGLRIYWNT